MFLFPSCSCYFDFQGFVLPNNLILASILFYLQDDSEDEFNDSDSETNSEKEQESDEILGDGGRGKVVVADEDEDEDDYNTAIRYGWGTL